MLACAEKTTMSLKNALSKSKKLNQVKKKLSKPQNKIADLS